VGGSDSELWKSTDYGNTWKNIATTDDVPEAPRGVVFAVAGTTPATIWAAGYNEHRASRDDGGFGPELRRGHQRWKPRDLRRGHVEDRHLALFRALISRALISR
jgi:hypothetical protein